MALEGTILVVDDNPTNIDILFTYLNQAGFHLLAAEDGEDALEQLEYSRPDIILMDIMMPGANGYEVCVQLKKRADTKHIPVIFMTALADDEHKLKGFEVGAVDYITKPFKYAEVLARVKAHMTIHNLQKNLEAHNKKLKEEIALRRETEAMLEEQAKTLAERNKELDAFAHTIAHDLKAPMNIIMGHAEIMQFKAKNIPHDLLVHLQTIAETGKQMGNITDELLLLAGMHQNSITLDPIDMASIIEGCKSRLAFMIKQYQAEITINPHWPVALGYPPWVEQVWVNYLSNALKYGGRPPKIEFGSTYQTDGQIRYWIRDNGQGLSAEEQATLFTEFTRLNQVNVEGHGLGLSIVKRIVDKLNGQVGVESEVGRGSLFYFTLPGVTEIIAS